MNHVEFSKEILILVGGEKNVSNFTHCITRLRFNVKDKSIVKAEDINKIKGVMGSQWQGEQFQVIVGAESDKLYSTLCKIGNFENSAKINTNLDQDLEKRGKWSWKSLGYKALNYLSPMMTSVIPLMVAGSLCKVIAYLLGPDFLKVIAADNGLYVMLNLMYDAFFYFLPVFLGYVAGKVLNYNPIYGIYLGTLIIVPGFINLVGVQNSLDVLGMSFPIISYSNSFLPVLLGGLVCKYILGFLEDHIPSSAKALLIPLLTVLIMAPVMLGICAPLGTYIGNYLGNFFMYLSSANSFSRIIGATLITIAWPFIILLGMHGGLSAFAMSMMNDYGYDPFLFNTAYVANVAVFGIALGVALKLKSKENKSLTLNYFFTCILVGVTEPILYGVLIKYKKSILGLISSCAIGGFLCGIFVPKLYVYTSTSVLGIWACWMNQEDPRNAVIGNAILLITFIVSVAVTYLMKYNEDA